MPSVIVTTELLLTVDIVMVALRMVCEDDPIYALELVSPRFTLPRFTAVRQLLDVQTVSVVEPCDLESSTSTGTDGSGVPLQPDRIELGFIVWL